MLKETFREDADSDESTNDKTQACLRTSLLYLGDILSIIVAYQ